MINALIDKITNRAFIKYQENINEIIKSIQVCTCNCTDKKVSVSLNMQRLASLCLNNKYLMVNRMLSSL